MSSGWRDNRHARGFRRKRIRVLENKKQEFYFHIEEESSILCRNCGHVVTAMSEIIAVGDRHRHTFGNPSGTNYEIGCFATANGCTVQGKPSLEYTWFAGFGWSIALCSHCGFHLGWFYESEGEHFFGLILHNILENIRTH